MDGIEQGLAAIDIALIAFAKALTPAMPADLGLFVQSRLALSRAVNAFFAERWGGLPNSAAGAVDTPAQQRERTIYQAFVALRMRYSAHITKWNSQNVAAAWPAYRADCLALISGMRELLALRAQGGVGLAA